jgi:hypothetical protein
MAYPTDDSPRGITLTALRDLLATLKDDDFLVPNTVRNLAIYRKRDGRLEYAGYVDIAGEEIDLFDRSDSAD